MRQEFYHFYTTGFTKTTSEQADTHVPSEANQVYARTFKLTRTDPATLEQIPAEITCVPARVNDLDESFSTRLDPIDGALKEI